MVYGYIYKIENLVNGKVYIGQTTNKPNRRRNDHFNHLKKNKHPNRHLQFSFNKYGLKNFSFNLLTWVNSKKELDQVECYFIDKYDCLNDKNGYNIKTGGSRGKHSAETKKLISEHNKMHLPEIRMKVSKALIGRVSPTKGKKLSEEHRRKLSESHKKENHHNYGKPLPLEIRKNISKSPRKNSLFGFLGANYQRTKNPEMKCWASHIMYNKKRKHLSYFQDPLSCQIVHDLVLDAIYN